MILQDRSDNPEIKKERNMNVHHGIIGISVGDNLLKDGGQFIGHLTPVKVGAVCSDTGTFTLAGYKRSPIYDMHTLKDTSPNSRDKYYRLWEDAESYIMAMLGIDVDEYNNHLAKSHLVEHAFQIGIMFGISPDEVGDAFIGMDITEMQAGELCYEMFEELIGAGETNGYKYFDVAAWFSDILLEQTVQEHDNCYFVT